MMANSARLWGKVGVSLYKGILGHESLKATMRYTQVSRVNVECIDRPLDKRPW
jgi:integrase/recombinase XerD